jgi:uncharacterized protein involved in outer membrane biogenesis
MRKFVKWLAFTFIALLLTAVGILTVAYWNRDVLLERLTEKLNQGINGELHIGKIDFTFLHHFPNFSISLKDLYVRGERYDSFPRDIFSAKKIFLDLKILPLLNKEIQVKSLTVDNASIFIFRTLSGYTNTDIVKPSQDSSSAKTTENETPLLLSLQKIDFRNVSIVYADSVKNKYMSFQFLKTQHTVNKTDSIYSIGTHGRMHFDGLIFNAAAGSFLTDKDAFADLHIAIDPTLKVLTAYPSSLTIDNSTIDLTGQFQLPRGGKYNLTFSAVNLVPTKAKELLNEKLTKTLDKFDIQTPVTIKVALSGRSTPGVQPNVDIQFDTKDAIFQYRNVYFSDLTLVGSFTNHKDSTKINDNDNSEIIIKSFVGKMGKLPISGNVSFTPQKDPLMDLAATIKLSYREVNDQMDTTRFVLKSGNFTSSVKYSGKLTEYLDSTRTVYNGKLKGSCSASEATLLYKSKKLLMSKINALCEFDEKQFTINDLRVRLNNNAVSIKGYMKNFIPFFIRPESKGYVKLSITSPTLDLTPFANERNKVRKKTSAEIRRKRKKMTDLFDVVYNTLEFDLDVNVGDIVFRKFNAKNLNGKVKLNDNTLEAGPITMQFAGGTMGLNFILSRVFEPISPLAATATIANADIQQVFRSFNNFNQNTILADNLSGSISANIKFNAELNEHYNVQASSMRGVLDCKIRNGALIDFQPMENMSNFLFKKRDFTNIQFAELNSSFSVEGTALDISRMEIQSTVLSMFLQGRYSFTDSTSLSVQLPLSNLKKRNKDFKLENMGTKAKVGPSVYLHVYRNKDINSKINIAYDPFKKWLKN